MISILRKGVISSLLVLILWPASTLSGAGRLVGISVKSAGEATEVSIEGTESFTHNAFFLDSPPRIVVDLPGTWNHLTQKKFLDLNRGGILAIRTSQYKDDLSRVVIDLQKELPYSVYPGEKEVTVVFTNPGGKFQRWQTVEAKEAGGEEPQRIDPQAADAEPQTVDPQAADVEPETQGITAEAGPKLITVDFHDADIRAVIRAFSEFSGVSIVAGREVEGKVTAKIMDLPWDKAFGVLMRANGYGVEIKDGIYRVDRMEALRGQENLELLEPTVISLNYVNPEDISSTIESMLSERGSVQTDTKTNSLVVADVPERVKLIRDVVTRLDVKTEQVTIKSKLLFVNSVDLRQLGIDWKASNLLDPTVDTYGEVKTGQTVADPFLEMTFGTFKTGTSISTILEALEENQMIDVQAQPQITTLDNLEASVFVGEKTPIRVLDVGAQATAAASIELIETGIKLTVTPHITNDRKIIMDLKAERSSAVTVPTEFGVEFQTQEGKTTLMVEDGQTAVIGGLTTVDTVKTHRGVPILSKIPLLGRLFRYTSDRVEKKDLLIFVTPYIAS